jgi:tetratricopeptide (TPR) repeat protein
MADADVLFDVRTNFLLGNYQGAINEANNVNARSDKDRLERDVYVYRSYIALSNYQMVLDEVPSNNAHPSLQAVKLLATYLSSENNKDIAMVTVKEWMSDGVSAGNQHLQVVAGTIYIHEQLYEDAMRCLHQSNSLEGLALLVQAYLKIDRLDLAEKELQNMKKTDEDATITQLATAWVNTLVGGDRLQEAYFIFKELSDKYGATPTLLNGLAVCSMHMKKFEEAERYLLEALEKNSKDADTLTNIITCYLQLKKSPEVVNRYVNQLKTGSPNHSWVIALKNAEESFERASTRFAL